MRALLIAAAALLFAGAPASAQEQALGRAAVRFDGAVLTLTTGSLTRRFAWNDGHLISLSLRDEARGREIALLGDGPDIRGPGIAATAEPGQGQWSARIVAADGIAPAHIAVTVTARLGSADLRRRCTLVPDSPAIRCTAAFRGISPRHAAASTGREMIESETRARDLAVVAADRLALPGGPHWRADIVRLQAATDYHDNLVQRSRLSLYREPKAEVGAIAHLQRTGARDGLFLLREAPLGADQTGWAGADFILRSGEVTATAAGIDGTGADADRWEEAYPVTIGMTDGTEEDFRLRLRQHMMTIRPFVAARDAMLMSNSWGDRSRDARMTEAFMLAEVERAAALGLSVVQLDDGWQAGLSKNSASKAGAKWEDWSAADWQPHPARFPRGLAPVEAAARARGIAIGIWFNPSQARDFAAWQRDADIIIDLWRRHGIAHVKIDGVHIPTRRAEANLVAMFDRISTASRGAIVINMDVTAGRRPAFFAVNRYGNIFLENRYTDWGNYYPHRTLRNLWQLAAYVPPQWIQAEFLNVARNADKYAADDPLAPAAVGQRFALAATLAGQPLAWMETTGLPTGAVAELAPMIAAFRAVQAEWHSQPILPIGEEPKGSHRPGFQSFAADGISGFLMLYQEPLAARTGAFRTLLPPGALVQLTPLLGPLTAQEARVGPEGALTLPMPPGAQAALLRYRIKEEAP